PVFAREVQELDVEPEPGHGEAREDQLGGAGRESFEARLGVEDPGQERDPHHAVEQPAHQVACVEVMEERRAHEVTRLGEHATGDRHVGAAVQLPHHVVDLFHGVGEIGVGEHAPGTLRRRHATRHRKALAPVGVVAQQGRAGERAGEVGEQPGGARLAVVVHQHQLGGPGLGAYVAAQRFEVHGQAVRPVPHRHDDRQVDGRLGHADNVRGATAGWVSLINSLTKPLHNSARGAGGRGGGRFTREGATKAELGGAEQARAGTRPRGVFRSALARRRPSPGPQRHDHLWRGSLTSIIETEPVMHAPTLLLSPALLVAVAATAPAQTPVATWDSVAQILQAPASATGGYYRYGLPRRDVTLKIGDVTVSPALALGSWAGFSGEPSDATVMGDLVLLTAEVKPVLAELARQRLDVTAVHNHLVGEEPQLTYVHFHGHGRATDLARQIERVLAR